MGSQERDDISTKKILKNKKAMRKKSSKQSATSTLQKNPKPQLQWNPVECMQPSDNSPRKEKNSHFSQTTNPVGDLT
jgi:hypothetical protein